MKVILLQDVAKIGRRYDVADVPDGYALNMLIPKGLAKAGTPENIRSIEARKDRAEQGRQAEGAAFKEAAEKAAAITITVTAPANEQGHLFQALKPEVIAAAYAEKGIALAPANINIEASIKEVGEHEISLVSGDENVSVNIQLIAE